MPPRVNTLVITGYGTNCEVECAHAAEIAGSDSTRIVHFADLVSGDAKLADCNFLIFPGGFLDGDDLGAAQAASIRWQHAHDFSGRPLLSQLAGFIEQGGIILGICNGFQLLVKLGLLPGFDGQYFQRRTSLAHNESGRYEDRWVTMKVNPQSPCIFTRGLDILHMPVRHGEGRLVADDEATMERLLRENLIALQYVHPETLETTMEYPYNPNGSPHAIAGLTDLAGRIFGLMPHPDAFTHPTNHPGWGRGEQALPGTAVLANGIRYLREAAK